MQLTVDRVEVIRTVGREMEHKSAEEILRHAVKSISSLTFACSFGAEDMVLVDMISKIAPDLPIFYLDTELLFDETYALRDQVLARYKANLIRVRPTVSLNEQVAEHGEKLWEREPNLCCEIRKVQPLQNHLKGYAGWITGIRREQSPTRANAQVFEVDEKFGLVKVNPIALWVEKQVWDYIKVHDVPYNPLHDQGYPSIGCQPCTRAVAAGEDPRSGRWAGFVKTECGLHK